MEAANYGILSLIPLALTLLLAFWKKDAVFALFMGCLSGVLLLGHDPAFGSDACFCPAQIEEGGTRRGIEEQTG